MALAPSANLDIAVVVGSSLLLLFFLRKDGVFRRWQGVTLVLGYLAYVLSLGLRA